MIGLMDCNNFFVSCERLFRPDLRTKPVLVLSSNDGCVIARSQEVKDMGISMGTPYFQIKDMCHSHGIHVFSSNFKLYRDISYRVTEALRSEFPVCEVYSIDEAFFDVFNECSVSYIEEVRTRIIGKTGIPVSFGIAHTKTIAKIASQFAKKNEMGVCALFGDAWLQITPQIPCGTVWGIGAGMMRVLGGKGVHTVFDLCAKGQTYLQSMCGVVGERIYLELSEKPAYTVGNTMTDTPQSMVSSQSFGERTGEKKVLISAIAHHISRLGARLRKEGMVVRSMSIICEARDETRGRSPYTHFDIPTQSSRVLMKEALRLLDGIYEPHIRYGKAGVCMSGLVPMAYAPGAFFSDEKTETDAALDAITDTLNTRFGAKTLGRGVLFLSKKWEPSHKVCSPAYTTDWQQIPIIKAA